MHSSPKYLIPGILLTLGTGCADDGRLPTYPVSGKVVYSDGTPLKGGWIVCESPEHGLAARGIIEQDGTFLLGTYEPSDGAVEGKQRVAITPAAPEGFDPDQGRPPPTLDEKFLHMDKSGLEFTVQPESENQVTITVDRPRR